jgi:hypothetical protein
VDSFEKKIREVNFRKAVVIYIVVLAVVFILCAAVSYFVFHDRIGLAFQYAKLKGAVEAGNAAAIQTEADNLAVSSADIVDVLILDGSNDVMYSAKKSQFSEGKLDLERDPVGDNYYSSSSYDDFIFRYVKNDEFMMKTVFNTDFGEIKNEYDNESFYEDGLGSKTVLMLGYFRNTDLSQKIFIISSPTSVTYGILTLKADAVAAILLFMIYWVLTALWVYASALKSGLNAPMWGIVAILTNLAGVLAYQIYRHANVTCPGCGVSMGKMNKYCTNCGTRLGDTCLNCGTKISGKDRYCPECGERIMRK